MDGAQRGFDYYRQIADELGDAEIARYDREESARYGGGMMEHEQAGGKLTFSDLCRSDQAAVLHAIDTNLEPTKRAGSGAPNSYEVKHAVERYTGFYVSNLQAKVALRMLGYERTGDDLTPTYNVSVRSWREFDRVSCEVNDRRMAAVRNVERDREVKACARYFHRLTA